MSIVATSFAGCNGNPEEATPEVATIKFPAGAQYPIDLIGTWKMDSVQTLSLEDNGACKTSMKVSTAGADLSKMSEQSAEGRWGVSDNKLFIELKGQPTIEYDYKIEGSKLTMGKGKTKFSYKKTN